MSRSNTVRASAVLIACALLLNASTAAAQDFVLQFRDGLVTLVAREQTVPTILKWWARLGNVTVVNGEKIEGAPVTLQLVDVPERDALAILLRNVGGYILAARHDEIPGVPVFDRIVVLQSSGQPIRNLQPLQAAQATTPSVSADNFDLDPGVAGRSAEPIVPVPPPAGLPQGGMAVAGAAPFASQGPFAPKGNASGGPAGMPTGTASGTARPGEMTAPPPMSRTSAGPQRPPEPR